MRSAGCLSKSAYLRYAFDGGNFLLGEAIPLGFEPIWKKS